MASVRLIPQGKKKEFTKDTLLLDALLDMGAHIQTACGGKGICGKCKVRAEGRLSEPDENENNLVEISNGWRLACRSRIHGDVRVWIDDIEAPVSNRTHPILHPNDTYAAAIDIGTTSVTVSLVNLVKEKSTQLSTFMNPQRRYGHDVISRISAAADIDIFQNMSTLIQGAVIHTMSDALKTFGILFGNIKHITFSGNTTMLYLLFGLDVSPLGRYPYQAEYIDFFEENLTEKTALINIPEIKRVFPEAQISALPAVNGFLGSDMVGGLALCHGRGLTENTFFIDIGTNGELFVINKQHEIYAASCAMGPALEGMNTSWGMTADDGAITHARIESGKIRHEIMGNGSPRGIAGTALVDLLAIFLEMSIIRPDGAFCRGIERKQLPAPASYENSTTLKRIRLWGEISVNQKDIRNVQLAKGASLAASRLVLKKAGRSPEQIKHVVIAGALGKHLSITNLKKLAFIPDFPDAQYHYLGNASLAAAEEACLDRHFIKNAMMLRDRVRDVNLSMLPEFNKEFMNALDFR